MGVCGAAWIFGGVCLESSGDMGVFFDLYRRVCQMAMGDTALPERKMAEQYYARGSVFILIKEDNLL